jgi:hypothetical protein
MRYPNTNGVQVIAFVRAVLCLVVFALTSHSAPVWVATYNGTSNAHDVAENIVRASDGSLFVTGFSGPQNQQKAVVVKYNPSGQQLWAVENTNISQLDLFLPLPLTAVDSGGALRLAGKWAPTGNEIALVNYSAERSLLWERHFREGVESYAHALAVDASGNTIVVGWCKTNLAPDALILKYAPDGTLVWKRFYSFTPLNSEQAFSVTTLPDGEILVGIDSEWQGPVLLKFSADGELLWTAEPGGVGLPWQLIVDASGNILVSAIGFFEEDLLIKLDSSGQILWTVSDNFSESRIAVDAEGNIYATSPSRGLIVARYNANGVRQWTSRFSMDNDYASAAVGITAHQGGVSIGFNFFDLSVAVHRFAAAHYDSNGVEVWRETYSQTGGASAMAGDSAGGIYLTGAGGLPTDLSIQTIKFQVTVPPSLPQIIVPPQNLDVVAGTNRAVFSVQTANGPNTFQWRRWGLPIPDATNATLELTEEIYDGPISVIVSNAFGYVSSPNAQLNVYDPPTIRWFSYLRTNEATVVGEEFIFGANVGGSPPITMEWYRDGVLLAETNSVFILGPLTTTDSGAYTVVARSPYGAATNAPISVTVAPRTALDYWRWSTPLPQGNPLNAVDFGNGRFVAVGASGTILTSGDGFGWSVTNLGRADLKGVCFGNGTFAAVSTFGTVYTSPDGLSWTRRAGEIPSDGSTGIAFLNDRFVAWGWNVRSSDDGSDWVHHGRLPDRARSIVFGQGKYVMTSSGSSVAVSTNLNNWREFPVGDGEAGLYGAAYGNNVFVFSNPDYLYTSADGIQISDPRPGFFYTANVAFINNRFFGVGRPIRSSPDGSTWTEHEVPSSGELHSIAYGNSIYVAVGSQGLIVRSSDGQTWTSSRESGPQYMRLLAYGNGQYIAVGAEGHWSSTDGQTWTHRGGALMEEPSDITCAHGTFVMVGRRGDIAASKDGINWVRTNPVANALAAVIHDGHRFVSVGGDSVLVSTNGIQWHVVPSIDRQGALTIAHAAGLYVMFVNDGSCRISTNLVNWEVVDSDPSDQFGGAFSVTYGNGHFVGVAGRGAFVSEDGRIWTTHEISRQHRFDFVTFAGGMFIAVSGNGIVGSGNGGVATSTNGQHWVIRKMPVRFAERSSAFYLNGALWVPGSEEGIIRSAQVEPFVRARKTGSDVELVIEAFPGRTYRLQKSATPGNWSDFRTFTPQTETTTVIDGAVSGQGGAFYRVIAP